MNPLEALVLDLVTIADEPLTTYQLLSLAGMSPVDGRMRGTMLMVVDGLRQHGLTWSADRADLPRDVREPRLRALRGTDRYAELYPRIAAQIPLFERSWSLQGPRSSTVRREVRRALYTLTLTRMPPADADLVARAVADVALGPPDDGLWRSLPPELAEVALAAASDAVAMDAAPGGGLRALSARLVKAGPTPELRRVAAREALLAGDLEDARSLAKGLDPATDRGLTGLLHLIDGRPKEAAAAYHKALAGERKRTKSRKSGLPMPEGMLQPLAYVLEGSDKMSKAADDLIAAVALRPWAHLARLRQPDLDVPPAATHPLGVLLEHLVGSWLGKPIAAHRLADAKALARAAGWAWVEHELGAGSLLKLRKMTSDGESRLDAIEALLDLGPLVTQARARIAWVLRTAPLRLEALEQVRTKTGWSAGKRVPFSRLRGAGSPVESLDADDRKLLTAVRARHHFALESDFEWAPHLAWPALVGHPRVYDAAGNHLTIVGVRPRVEVHVEGAGRVLRSVPVPDANGVHVEAVGDRGFEVCVFDEAQLRIARLLGDGLAAPASRATRLADGLAARFDVTAGEAQRTVGDPRAVVQLRPAGSGARVRVVVRPLGPAGPTLVPGLGAASVLSRVGEQAQRAERDLDAERTALLRIGEIPGFEGWDGTDTTLPDAVAVLELLDGVRALGDDVVLEWPEGQALRLRNTSKRGKIQVSVRGTADEWLAASGSLQVDADLALSLGELVERMGTATGRFVRLDDGSFVALTAELARQLAGLARVGRVRQGRVEVHPLVAGALAPLADVPIPEIEPRTDIPTSLQAELRPDQADGYRWLMRMAALGAGACLADDMGLGKTVTTLAALLARADEGPALVVAPTSVVGVWRAEAWRFAPSLRFVDLDAAAPGTVVVTSYGMLARDPAKYAAIQWATVVLDEAHAIKNPETQRHKAALQLNARFRVALTGTPVENRLQELWALSSFLNPGMLGTVRQFGDRFVRPIEAGNRDVQQHLRRVATPFVLRRTKAQVLQDLPPRTEIQLDVELGPEQAAIYDATRQRALDALTLGKAGHIELLAEITRLRLAACHARLILPDGPDVSAKRDAFAHIVEALAENHHRALVFSQFVRHLTLIREWLDARGISYQYLDGETPAAERDKRVAAFQAGQGELFLISLRAGGFGLNLTAADYVVHLDPWWNPAVEDQASDRAHRIGQTRPVTVYRLVAKGTIEERIVALHRTKRDLADKVLEGADMAAGLSAEELAGLIRAR